MKKTLLATICFIAYAYSTQAQTLYGTTLNGGSDGGGTINKFIPATNDLTVGKSFGSLSTFRPKYTNFIQATNGKLYGMTSAGGSGNVGTIFSFNPANSTYTNLKDFDNTNTDGADPEGSLIQAKDGKLYGMTNSGGSVNAGVIFSFDPSNSSFTKLKEFDYTNGSSPYGSLMQASDGKLYGMTNGGGSAFAGVIFSFDPSTSTLTRLKDFDNTDGANPYGNLMQARDGKLYGMTSGGGSLGHGVIFSFDPSSSTYTKMKDFDNIHGANPYGSLMQANDGKLYGMTSAGGAASAEGGLGNGVIFSFVPSSSTYTDLKEFDYTHGSFPFGNFIQASDGKLYGTTSNGNPGGVIFAFDPSAFTYTTKYVFDATDGQDYGSLIQANDGKLYGMTFGGANYLSGVIFSFDPSASSYTRLKNFVTNENGTDVSASLVQAGNGKLIGITNIGGSLGYGVIFSFDPTASGYTKLYDFDGSRGANPYSSLIHASDGKLYGTTMSGGLYSGGVIYSFDPSASTYVKLYDFGNRGDGRAPGKLIQATDGKLYGITRNSSGTGAIFSFDPSNSTYTTLNLLSGTNPNGGFIQASNGKLYGMTADGGSSDAGVIFSLDPSTSISISLVDFDNTNGSHPYSNLLQAIDGKLYGMTSSGGSNDDGVIFSFDPSTSTLTKLKDFDNIDGANPYGDLMQARDGKLYGMTRYGGSNNDGVVFSFDPISSGYTKLKEFDGTNGAGPYIGSAFIEVSNGALPVTVISFTGKNRGNSNQLSWKVDNEQNLNYYELQRSTDGQNFKGIAQIKAAGRNNYTYTDRIVPTVSSVYYYRLKSVDKDGKFTFSVIVKLRSYLKGFLMVYPNPFDSKLVVSIESPVQDKALLLITDAYGRQVYKENKPLSPGTNVFRINDVARLPKGTYLLTVIDSQETQSIKVVKGK